MTDSGRLNRRSVLQALAFFGSAGVAGFIVSPGRAHTPYRQWVVYRKKHLLIGAHRKDLQTYDLARSIVAHLESHLPKAQARVARAPDRRRLASLLGTDQLDVAVLSKTDAEDMVSGAGDLSPYGPISIRVIREIGDYVLVVHARFREDHTLLVSNALSDFKG
ncbi:MAG: hypothetical protein AAGE89_16375 [Pseudomonadota bacterium]